MSDDVDLLRRAAAKVRETAEAAGAENAPPWRQVVAKRSGFDAGPSVESNGGGVLFTACSGFEEGITEPATADHIALFDPTVALAVADILDEAVIDAQRAYYPEDVPRLCGDALALARAILRETSP